MSVIDKQVEEYPTDFELDELRDEFLDITADLVALKQNSKFLQGLFSVEAGAWVEVASLCRGLRQVEARLTELETTLDSALLATWLNYPDASHNPDFCVILFFAPEPSWSNAVTYHKALFSAKLN